ncbi:MAG: type II secretion system protein GspM [Paracoccaceae bacterium]
MSARPLPSLAERALALALLAALLAAFAILVVLPLVERARQASAAARANYDLAERLSRVASSEAEAQRTIASLRERIDESALFLRAETEMLAQVALQDRLETIVDGERAELGSVTLLPTSEADGFERVRLRARFEAGYEGVLRVLHRVESGVPALFVDRLRLEPVARRAAGDGREDDRLSVDLDVYGYLPPEVPG